MVKLFVMAFILLSSLSCSSMPKLVKMKPEYKGIDPRVKTYYDEYVALAKLHNITFVRKITIGFKKINDGNAVGMCSINGLAGFREIDIDTESWNDYPAEKRTDVIFHELTHCLCGRGHDFGKDKYYPEPNTLEIFTAVKNACVEKEDPKGFYDDQCPLSLMHPNTLPPDCVTLHYPDYIKEMFDRCDPW